MAQPLIHASNIERDIMRILVTTASKHGSTREIAEVIAQELQASPVEVEVRNAEEVGTLTGYDAVILGSGIYAGSWLPAARQFVERNRAALARIPVWLFSSGPLGDDPQPKSDPQKLIEPLGNLNARDHQVFVGKLLLRDLGFAERLLTRAIGAPEGDFRDWDAIRSWARTILAELPSALAAR